MMFLVIFFAVFMLVPAPELYMNTLWVFPCVAALAVCVKRAGADQWKDDKIRMSRPVIVGSKLLAWAVAAFLTQVFWAAIVMALLTFIYTVIAYKVRSEVVIARTADGDFLTTLDRKVNFWQALRLTAGVTDCPDIEEVEKTLNNLPVYAK